MTAQLVEASPQDRTEDPTVCQNCGHYVTDTFRRVFGDNQNELYGCLNCSTMRDLRSGAGVKP
jgi:DNA-directed RNA polymerase subunit RPC12/RpoP